MAARAVLVTGASRGIGAAVARAFAASGDRVGVHYGLRRDAALEVRASLPGDGHVVAGADLAHPEAVRRMVDEVAGALGGIDVLVNNAGVFEPHAATQTSYEEWQAAWAHTLGVNLIGAANVTWCVLRHMGAGGRIVNVSSRGAFRGEPNHPAYGASKAGLISLTQNLARALAPEARVNAVAPGFVDSDWTRSWPAARKQASVERALLKRACTPADIATAIVFLCADASMVTAQTLVVDGGYSL